MSRKRRNTSSPEPSSSPEPPAKRRAPTPSSPPPAAAQTEYLSSSESEHEERSNEKPQQDKRSGQTAAFPGLSNGDAEEDDDNGQGGMFYGPAGDGIEYLRMVRSEARGVPALLVAPKGERGGGVARDQNGRVATMVGRESAAVEERDDGAADSGGHEHRQRAAEDQDADVAEGDADGFGGYYEDDAYIARPVSTIGVPQSKFPTAQVRYWEVLLAQFNALQATLRCEPPSDKVAALDKNKHPTQLPRKGAAADEIGTFEDQSLQRLWKSRMGKEEPNIVQLALMDQTLAWRLLMLLRGVLAEAGDLDEMNGFTPWFWALLAKLPGLGQLAAEEVSDLRDLARSAISHIHWGRASGSVVWSGPRSVGPGKEHVKQIITLDMVVTVVGEVYGQKDLLEDRELWWKR